ncbi:DUF2388 domain-containing protein [Pseudomonas luteola]
MRFPFFAAMSTVMLFPSIGNAQEQFRSSVTTAQTYYLTLIGPTASSNASTNIDKLAQYTEEDSAAYIASDGEILGPALESEYRQALDRHPGISRKDVALSKLAY